jgi:long-chain acyl-CoA synthetase
MLTRDPLLQAFANRLDRHPSATVVAAPGHSATTADIDAIASAVDLCAREAGLEPGRYAALVADNGPAFLGLLLGLRRSGATVVLFDRRATIREIEAVAERLPLGAIARCPSAWPASAADWSVEPRSPAAGPAADSRIAVVKLTSGSEGEPRGVATPASALLADDEALTLSMGILPEDRLLAAIPFSHSYGLSSLVMPALVRGTRLVLPGGASPFAPLEAARELGATVFPTVPAYLDGLLRAGAAAVTLGPLRKIVTAGAPLLPETAARFREQCGQPAHVFYGASECGGITYDRSGDAGERGEVGEPVTGVQLDLEPVPGIAHGGRVVVRSPAVAAGYLPLPHERLANGRFITDDLATRHDGRIKLAGRLGERINVRGKKIDPAEVEMAIAEHPAVDEARVVGVRREGSADESVRAFVACAAGALDEEALRRWCGERLSGFKVPRSFVLVERLPRNDRGKVDRAALDKLAGAAAGDRP